MTVPSAEPCSDPSRDRRLRAVEPPDAAHDSSAVIDAAQRLDINEVVSLTGVGRERLRTWERRFGYPRPVAKPSGRRTYHRDDLARIATISRLIERGVPVREAVASVRDGVVAPASWENPAWLDHCPMASIALTRVDEGWRVSWANGAALADPDGVRGDTPAETVAHRLGPEACIELDRLWEAPGGRAEVLLHPQLRYAAGPQVRSLAWRRNQDLLLIELPGASAPGGSPHAASAAEARWSGAVGAARAVLQTQRGLAAINGAAIELARGSGAVDGFLLLATETELRTARSANGTVRSQVLPERPSPALRSAVATGEAAWLESRVAADLGLPSWIRLLAVPLSIDASLSGAITLVMPERAPIDAVVAEMLAVFAQAAGANLRRDRAAANPARASQESNDAKDATGPWTIREVAV